MATFVELHANYETQISRLAIPSGEVPQLREVQYLGQGGRAELWIGGQWIQLKESYDKAKTDLAVLTNLAELHKDDEGELKRILIPAEQVPKLEEVVHRGRSQRGRVWLGDEWVYLSESYDKAKALLGGLTVPATPRTATEIFVAALNSGSFNINGAKGTTADLPWAASVNNADKITSFSDGDSVIQLTEAGEYLVHASCVVMDGGAANRHTFHFSLIQTDSADAGKEDDIHSGMYIRSSSVDYDSGTMGVHALVFAAAGDKLILRTEVIDAQSGASVIYPDTTKSRIRISQLA